MKQQKHNKSEFSEKASKAAKKYSTFLKYSSVSTEMIVTLLVCAYIGKYLDEYLKTNGPYFTIGFLLFGVFASLFILINGLRKISRKKEQNIKKKGKDDGFYEK
ncbi:AtpZ/AtpI family protein [Flammeovirga kamogawensis]|uniref:AtpZ/AtpI family protein n=1 Tax=Flammeovirga kamogawensis TaxID=373891 RepID=A0ABX8GQQ7_9BACT|nr:AtpZ/AtpI family protein [Flammeovirga kamogawensis]MBB6462031.1 F0F1-type ATP synthase assembly protein I [Flammeovirga kamogawensis]QWG05766.1 AtpZ/AtpI family protein [Flammeovirga kamogawensis]TRX67593.1 AtpZ/AtpI family protein [Flammeovirga kamogawensis]